MVVKTAVSLEESIFQKMKGLAQELHVSRSHLLAMAVEEFIERHENRQMFEAINAAYDDMPDPQEHALVEEMRLHHRQLVEGQW